MDSNTEFNGKVAVVTGAGSGIGRAIALALSQVGASVIIAERLEEAGKMVANEVKNAGGQAMSFTVDVSKTVEVNNVVKNTIDQFGKIDILVNNAGIARIENFLEGEEWRWDRIIAVNLKGVILFSRAVLDHMIRKNYGKIVNIASMAGQEGSIFQIVYGASKGGVIAFTKGLAQEMAQYKINVNCICPGVIETPKTNAGFEAYPNVMKPLLMRVPLGKKGRPEDVAALTVFLASDKAAYITGQCIGVNGGLAGG